MADHGSFRPFNHRIGKPMDVRCMSLRTAEAYTTVFYEALCVITGGVSPELMDDERKRM